MKMWFNHCWSEKKMHTKLSNGYDLVQKVIVINVSAIINAIYNEKIMLNLRMSKYL